MGRCGCNGTCGCALSTESDCLAITGAGSAADPWLISPVISAAAINRMECRADGLYASLWGKSATVATDQSTTSGTFTDLATAGPAVTVATGTAALVLVYCQLYNNTANKGSFMSYAVSGATTSAAADGRAVQATNPTVTTGFRGSAASWLTLTAGSNVFTAKYRIDTASTGNFADRTIIVVPINLLP